MMLKLLSIPSTDRGCIVIPILGFYLFEYKLRANYEYMTLTQSKYNLKGIY